MALAAVQTAMPLEKQTHPFFSKPLRNPSPERTLPSHDTHVEPPNGDSDQEQPDAEAQPSKTRKKRARKSDGAKDKKERGSGEKVQAPLDRFTRPLNVLTTGERTPCLEEDPNQDRKKRRKTASPPPIANHSANIESALEVSNLNWPAQLHIEVEEDAARLSKASAESIAEKQLLPHAPKNGLPANMEIPPIETDAPEAISYDASNHQLNISEVPDNQPKKNTPTKKILKISKNGKLTSPISAKSEPVIAPSPKKRRKRTASKVNYSTTVVVIKYGSDIRSRRAIGKKIEDILGGKTQPVMHPATTPKPPPKLTGPPKVPHPFFLGKADLKKDKTSTKPTVEANAPVSPKASRRSAVTPGKIRAESRMHQLSQSAPAFGPIGGSNKAKNQHGLKEPLWPSKDNAHVRNFESNDTLSSSQERTLELPIFRARKLKSNIIRVPHDEDLINRFSHELKPTIRKQYVQADMNFESPEDVRLPDRLLTTGVDIQERVRNQIRASLSRPGEQDSRAAGTHPAIKALFKDIEHTLTPFEQGTCESQSWVQKYAPTCASHVLQSGKEATVLRDWLQGLTVKSVISNASTSTAVLSAKKPPKKKRKKEVDHFIVSSDEEEEGGDLMELSDSETYGRSAGLRQKSMKRPRVSRHRNVIVMSGPHGCGKSATVYAVAKELGFEVFEINSSSRRSGKDVQDKVGDMSENHLVSNKRNNVAVKPELLPTDDTDNERMDEALQKDLDSGRQGTMTSFFTSKAQPKSKPKVKAKAKEPLKVPTSTQATLPLTQAPSNPQKQSLILLEEADVLFEEDQQFWAQVTKLARLSKRPVVITCNNEALIPTYDLPLAAILRLPPPPLDLAADYLLVMAALEGHILERKAVCDLLQSKGHDLRASITEMDFWCQMSVGDRKGGLEWIYQRWPPGKDVDANGRLIRVASQGTYLPGMGWLSHNVFVSTDNIGYEKGEELLKEIWTGWDVNPHNCYVSEKRTDLAIAHSQESPDERLSALKRLDLMSESLSAADVYCRVGLPSYEHHHQEITDPSLPPITDKELSGFTLMAPVIQVDHVSDFTNFDTEIFVTSHLSIQRAFGRHNLLGTPTSLSADTLTQTILQHKHKQLTEQSLTWPDFSEALDILASPPSTSLELSKSYQLTASSFDCTFRIITTDLAPYIRSIVAYERVREARRIKMSTLLSEGGTRKRPRTTRASRVAMEGGRRETKRRERWFVKELSFSSVMATAGSWAGLGSLGEEEEEEENRTRGSSVSTQTQQE